MRNVEGNGSAVAQRRAAGLLEQWKLISTPQDGGRFLKNRSDMETHPTFFDIDPIGQLSVTCHSDSEFCGKIGYGYRKLWRISSMVEENKKLRRSRSDRVIAGVCGGLGEFFGLSPVWFRLAFLLALIPGGIPGLGGYILFWLILPKE